MYRLSAQDGMSTLVTHYTEAANPLHAHVTPIYQTSTFTFPDTATGAAIVGGEQPGYFYTRLTNPNLEQYARKIALLEGIDLLRSQPEAAPEQVVAGQVFASGMAAVSAAILGRVHTGETIIAQSALYSHSFTFLQQMAERLGLRVVWVDAPTPEGWQAAFAAHPQAVLAYAETPANPTMAVVDLAAAAEIAHQHGAWLAVDNTFATPYCQRPLSLNADLVIHSTTKYLSGHGAITGGALVSRHVDFMHSEMRLLLKSLGASLSPFDAWLANLGLKTFTLRMERQCANALAVAQFLESHPAVAKVHYPGLESHPGYEIARRQMQGFGAMISFELKGGLQAGVQLMESVRIATLAVSLGNVDTLIQHPASMTHAGVPRPERLKQGISDGLVRLSVGIEEIEDLLADLGKALPGG
ncbi:MAG: aminotransferase class I/II-fold pyridoxal phosphate-dependent enzyme [Anaerolineales bacterium]|nr:aminotransferase class I/II-fold pyridoxal phosphate-dependent enzyme [Anaerolineales bacterium]